MNAFYQGANFLTQPFLNRLGRRRRIDHAKSVRLALGLRHKTGADLGSALITHAIAAQLLTEIDQAKTICRDQFSRRRDLLASLLRERLPEWEFTEPKGGLFLWVRLPAGDARYFAQCAARHAVAVTPCLPPMNRLRTICGFYVLDEAALALGVDRLAGAWSE